MGTSGGAVTVSDVLALAGPFRSLAEGVADGRYVFWLGSGISRERVPDLRSVIRMALERLHARANPADAECPYTRALERALEIADLRPEERDDIDLANPPGSWPPIDVVLAALSKRYSRFLGIHLRGMESDYMVWHAIDVVGTYGSPLPPDAEHICIAILALEGAVNDVHSANWDGLIETAVADLTHDRGAYLSVVVIPQEMQAPELALRLLKFHGCAVLAGEDPDKYRKAIVATRAQITKWSTEPNNALICAKMILHAATRPTLMIGFSAQDENIQQVFSQARAKIEWSWPESPTPHVFADAALGDDRRNIVEVIYGEDAPNLEQIEEEALIRAYAKPLLTALVISVLARKLRAYLERVDAPELDDSQREELAKGLDVLARRLAAAADPNPASFVDELLLGQRRALELFHRGREPASGSPAYRALGNLPASRVRTDAALDSSGVRELAATLALLGRGEAAGHWTVDLGAAPSGAQGALAVTTSSARSAVFFAAHGRAAVELEASGAVDSTARDTVVVHSTETSASAPRSPATKFGRTGGRRARHVYIGDVLHAAADVASLEQRFGQEAVLRARRRPVRRVIEVCRCSIRARAPARRGGRRADAFEFAALLAGERSLDLVAVVDLAIDRDDGAVRARVEGLAGALDLVTSRRALTVVLVGPLRGPDLVRALVRVARVITVGTLGEEDDEELRSALSGAAPTRGRDRR